MQMKNNRPTLSGYFIRMFFTLIIILVFIVSVGIILMNHSHRIVYGVEKECATDCDITITGDMYLRIKEGDPTMKVDDSQLVKFIRRRVIAPSRHPVKPYNLNLTDYSQIGQSVLVDDLLGKKQNGFHVEVGAADGETMSNTLFFEVQRNWTGLLVEANPVFFESLLRRNRHSYSINACLSPDNNTQAMLFKPVGFIGGLSEKMDYAHKQAVKKRQKAEDQEIFIQCYPFYSIFLAIGVTHIDYFSLDIEGTELDILRTIPWSAIRIDVFTIEYRRWNGDEIDFEHSQKKLDDIRRIFRKTELYQEVTLLPPPQDLREPKEHYEPRALDVVFKRKDLDSS